jgi:hypothetical protein
MCLQNAFAALAEFLRALFDGLQQASGGAARGWKD